MSTAQVSITGNTYPVKDQLKALGGRWNPDQKSWMVPADKADAARALVSGAGPKATYTPSRTSSYSSYQRGKCSHCGESCSPRYRTCLECSHGGRSFTTRDGTFILGSDD